MNDDTDLRISVINCRHKNDPKSKVPLNRTTFVFPEFDETEINLSQCHLIAICDMKKTQQRRDPYKPRNTANYLYKSTKEAPILAGYNETCYTFIETLKLHDSNEQMTMMDHADKYVAIKLKSKKENFEIIFIAVNFPKGNDDVIRRISYFMEKLSQANIVIIAGSFSKTPKELINHISPENWSYGNMSELLRTNIKWNKIRSTNNVIISKDNNPQWMFKHGCILFEKNHRKRTTKYLYHYPMLFKVSQSESNSTETDEPETIRICLINGDNKDSNNEEFRKFSFPSVDSVTEQLVDLRLQAHVDQPIRLPDCHLIAFSEIILTDRLKGYLEVNHYELHHQPFQPKSQCRKLGVLACCKSDRFKQRVLNESNDRFVAVELEDKLKIISRKFIFIAVHLWISPKKAKKTIEEMKKIIKLSNQDSVIIAGDFNKSPVQLKQIQSFPPNDWVYGNMTGMLPTTNAPTKVSSPDNVLLRKRDPNRFIFVHGSILHESVYRIPKQEEDVSIPKQETFNHFPLVFQISQDSVNPQSSNQV